MNNTEKILNRFGHENHFRVPVGYFEDFQKQTMQAISLESGKKQAQVTVFRWLATAAAVAAIVTISGFSYHSHHQQSLANQQDAYDTYLMAQIDNNNLMEFYLASEME